MRRIVSSSCFADLQKYSLRYRRIGDNLAYVLSHNVAGQQAPFDAAMFTLHVARRRGVYWGHFTGVVASAELEAFDKAVIEYAARNASVHTILDFFDADAMAIPETTIVHRARRPQIMPERKRVIVVRTFDQEALARLFVTEQINFGGEPPEIVKNIGAAFERLRVTEADFEILS